MRAVLSSGSNMGDARAHLQSVADEFARETIAASSIFATAPWGNTCLLYTSDAAAICSV